jgi:hypothetical protein
MIGETIDELKMNCSKPNNQVHSFILPEELEGKVETLEDKSNWAKLLWDISQSKLSLKEVTVIRIYFTFLNFKNVSPAEADT